MSNILQLEKYKCLLTPFSQKLIQYDNIDSRFFLSRASNFYLNSFTYGFDQNDLDLFKDTTTSLGPVYLNNYSERQDSIIDGFKTEIRIDEEYNDCIIVKCFPGTCVIDSTMVVLLEPVELKLCLSTSNIENGVILLVLSYRWNESLLENPPVLKLFMVSSDGTEYLPSNVHFNSLLDRLVINKFTLNFSNGQITNIKTYYPDPINKNNTEFLLIQNKIYEVSPIPNFIFKTRSYINQIIIKKQIYEIDSNSDKWVLETAPFSTDNPDEFCYYELDISIINNKDCVIQCYIDDMKIDPACIQHISSSYARIWMPKWFTNLETPKKIKCIVIG